MVELGLHNPLAAALGANGESEMVLAKQVLSAQPAQSLLINDRYYGVPELLVGLPAEGERHFLVRVKKNLKRRLLEVLSRRQRVGGNSLGQDDAPGARDPGPGAARRARVGDYGAACGPVCWTGAEYPAAQLLALYARRWEQEVFYKELKVDMRSTPVSAEPHAVDGHARDRRADPGLCGVGGLPHRGRRAWALSGCCGSVL